MNEPGPTDAVTQTREPAELERRFHAFVVDRLLAWGLDAAAAYLVIRYLLPGHPVAAAAAILAAVLLVGALLAVPLGLTGSSPGRGAAGVRVVDVRTGAPIGVRRAAARQLVLGLATLPTLGLGAAVLAWTVASDPGGRRRGWHDRLVGSEVVDARALRVAEDEPEESAPRHLVNLTALRLVPVGSAMPAAVARPRAPRTQPDPPAATAAAPPWRIAFDTGESMVVDGPVLLGRDPEARPGEAVHHLVPLRSADLSVSKTHAQLRLTAQGLLVVTDRGSTNGSTLLRQGAARELPAERAITLLAGDRVRFGDREMRVLREPADRTPTT